MNQTLKAALLAALTLSLSACNGSTQKFFDSLDLKVTERNGSSYVQLSSTFELGNVALTQATFTVHDPNANQDVGTVSFEQLPTTQGQIILDVNATLLAHADATLGESLPNGRALPLSLNLQHGDALAVKVGESSRVYLGGSLKTTIFAGVAFGIKGLDQVMQNLNTAANVFFLWQPNAQLMGVGGIYGSPVANQNGAAVFAKYTRSGNELPEGYDESMDNDFYQLDRSTQGKVTNFFYGKPRAVEIY